MDLTDEDGVLLVQLSRRIVQRSVLGGERMPTLMNELEKVSKTVQLSQLRAGVFVTLNKVVRGEEHLRGCIGLPIPNKPLLEGLVEASMSSAVDDPRFDPVSPDELDDIIVEVSVLTTPELIQVSTPREYPSRIQVGRDGLIIKWKWGSGLLLPQVPVEYRWDAEEFLCNTCMKAGSTPDCWLQNGTKIYKFQAVVFREVRPRGKVIRKFLE